jgi:ubiquinone/menaquinone biosynthesis C-methylase UbiE
MIKIASSRLKEKRIKNVDFQVGNVLKLDEIFNKKFDVVITDRCLINLNTYELQKEALSKIAKITKNNGHYIGIENFLEGQNEMNKIRREMKLPEIAIRWHNLFFKENEFKEDMDKKFRLIDIKNFSSSYYFATRIIYSKICQMNGEEPNYNHEIHQLAIDLPNFGNFSPIKCIILQKRE